LTQFPSVVNGYGTKTKSPMNRPVASSNAMSTDWFARNDRGRFAGGRLPPAEIVTFIGGYMLGSWF
jgi:hypothetical protein